MENGNVDEQLQPWAVSEADYPRQPKRVRSSVFFSAMRFSRPRVTTHNLGFSACAAKPSRSARTGPGHSRLSIRTTAPS